jgi:hypothetical protein
MRSCPGARSALLARRHADHTAAFVRATPASLGALLTMAHLIFRALVSTFVAEFGARLADRAGDLAASCHIARSQTADLGAVDIQGDAACHHFWVRLLQAGYRAVVARVRTDVAGVDTRLKQLISHDFSFKVWHTHSVHGRWHAPLDRSVVIKSFIHHAIFQGTST